MNEYLRRFASIARGGGDDSSLANQDLSAFLCRQPDVFFTDKLDRRGRAASYTTVGAGGVRLGCTGTQAARGEKSIDPARQPVGRDGLRCRLGRHFRKRRYR